MIKDTVGIAIKEEFKQEVFDVIDRTIENVLSAKNVKLTSAEKKKIKNLSLDQLNVNITSKLSSKTIWVFSGETTLPINIEREPGTPKGSSLIKKDDKPIYFKMKPNGNWVMTKKKSCDSCITKKEFEQKVLSMLVEDIETATFYGTSSYIGK